jgi:multidrug efflux pump subunit AcrB
MKFGLSGLLTRAFINSPLTPLLLLAAIVAGALALASLPREEEPQISVPMVDIIVQANGYEAGQAVELVTRPLEDIIKGINGVEHVYSKTEDDRVVVTARFLVGTDQDSAILRVHEKIRAHIGELPKGIPEPLIVGRGINDVAIVDLTLSARLDRTGQWSDNALFQVAEELQHELTKVDNVGSTFIVGGSVNQIRVEPDPERLAVYGVTLSQLIDKLTNANRSFLVGAFRDEGKSLPVLAGQTLQGVPDIGLLLLTTRDGRPVYVKDVADVTVGAAEPEHRAWTIVRLASGELQRRPAVTIAVAKRKDSNAVVVAEDVMRRLDAVKGVVIPADLEVSVTRNYAPQRPRKRTSFSST